MTEKLEKPAVHVNTLIEGTACDCGCEGNVPHVWVYMRTSNVQIIQDDQCILLTKAMRDKLVVALIADVGEEALAVYGICPKERFK